MKTTIKTTITAICAFGFIGLTSLNAVALEHKKTINNVAATNEEIATVSSQTANDYFLTTAEILTALEAYDQTEKYATLQILHNEKALKEADFLNTAESLTASGAKQEAEKYAEKQVYLLKTRNNK